MTKVRGKLKRLLRRLVYRDGIDHDKIHLAADICEQFIDQLALIDMVEDTDLFVILDEIAIAKGYTIAAHQRGAQGTHICFVETTDRCLDKMLDDDGEGNAKK
jgi:hypothetical protein